MTGIDWQIDPFYPWVAYAPNNRFGVIRAAVANDQHLEIGERLSQHAPNRIGQNATPLVSRDNNSYRRIHRSYIQTQSLCPRRQLTTSPCAAPNGKESGCCPVGDDR